MKYFIQILIAMSVFLNANSLDTKEKPEEKQTNVVVFMYHHFGEDRFPSTSIKLEQFQAQLDYLQVNNYNVWPLSKILYYIKNKYSIPEKTVAITIDDAYSSVYTHAYPMLKSKDFAYTVFVNTSSIGKKSISYMTWNQMRLMQEYGAEFANHSSTHAYLMPKKTDTKQQWQSMIKEELENAQRVLQKELGASTNEKPRVLSYPYGEYTLETAKYIEKLGYIGVTQTSGIIDYNSDFKRIPRFAMAEKFANIDDFILKLNAKALPVKTASPWDTKIKSNPPKLSIELQRPLSNIGCFTANGEAIELNWLSNTRFEVQALKALQGKRDRYTCTAPTEDGKWYWYSHLWIL